MTSSSRGTESRSQATLHTDGLTPARRLVFAVLPVCIMVIIAGVALEVGLRLRFEDTAQITGAAEWQIAEFGGHTYHWDRYHPRFGWTNQPDYTSDGSNAYSVTINSQGLRATRNYEPRSASGITRIALFGDSLAFGEEVDNGQTIADHLEDLRPDLEVLNYGVHGYGFGQSVLRLEDEGGMLEPDHYVVMVLFPEDLVRDHVRFFVHTKPVFRLVNKTLEVDNIPVPEASRAPSVLRYSYAAAWLFGRRGWWHRGPPDGESDLALGRAVAERAASVCRARGRPLTIVVLLAPAGIQRYVSDPRWRRQLDTARSEFLDMPMDVFDLVPAQEEAFLEEGRALFAPLAHWSSRGNGVWAEQIASHLDLKKTSLQQP